MGGESSARVHRQMRSRCVCSVTQVFSICTKRETGLRRRETKSSSGLKVLHLLHEASLVFHMASRSVGSKQVVRVRHLLDKEENCALHNRAESQTRGTFSFRKPNYYFQLNTKSLFLLIHPFSRSVFQQLNLLQQPSVNIDHYEEKYNTEH